MKKAILCLLLSVLLGMGLMSCGIPDDEENSEIISINLGFVTDEKNFRRVKINFLEDEKIIVDCFQESNIEAVVEYTASELLVKYLKETVIPTIDSKSEQQSAEEEALSWYIKIITDDANFIASGVGEETLPEYWEALLVLLEN